MIHEFHVQNYKALRDVKLKLTPMHVLIGPNDSGKTSILEALGALCRSVEMPLNRAFGGRWEGRELISHDSVEPIVRMNIGLAATTGNLGQCKYNLASYFDRVGQLAMVAEESLSFNGQLLLQTDAKERSATSAACRYATHPGSQASDDDHDAALMIHAALSKVHVYRLSPNSVALPVIRDAARRYSLDQDGFGLAQLLDDINDYSARRFVQLEDRFSHCFEFVDEISLEPARAFSSGTSVSKADSIHGDGDGKGIYFRTHGSGDRIPSSQVSDGMLIVLTYLALLYSPEPPRLLLIEEPENGIHPKLLEEVTTILRELVGESGKTQVIMTTHSPYLVDLFQPDEVTLCVKDENGDVRVRQFSDIEKVRKQSKVFTMGEIWTGVGDVDLANDQTAESASATENEVTTP